MFTSNSTKLNSVPIIAYNSKVHFARNIPFSQTRSHIIWCTPPTTDLCHSTGNSSPSLSPVTSLPFYPLSLRQGLRGTGTKPYDQPRPPRGDGSAQPDRLPGGRPRQRGSAWPPLRCHHHQSARDASLAHCHHPARTPPTGYVQRLPRTRTSLEL